MAGLSEHLKDMGDPVRSGQSLGSALSSKRLNGMMYAIRALARGDNVRAGYGLLRAASSDGVSLAVDIVGGRNRSAGHPFQVLNASTSTEPKVKVTFGQVNGITPTIGGYALDADPKDPPLLAVVTGVVYLAVVLNVNGTITSASIHNAAELPENDVTHGYLGLAKVFVEKTNLKEINQIVSHSLGMRRCGVSDIHFWGY